MAKGGSEDTVDSNTNERVHCMNHDGSRERSGKSSVVSQRVILGFSLGNSNFLLVLSLSDITLESLD